MIYIYIFHVLSNLLLIYICKLHWIDVNRRGWLDYQQVLSLLDELFEHHGDFRRLHGTGLFGFIGSTLSGGYFSY